MNDPNHGFVLPPFDSNSGDANFSRKNKIPVYQLQYNGLYKQLGNKTTSGKVSENQQEVFDGKINEGRDALETSGNKPETTLEVEK